MTDIPVEATTGWEPNMANAVADVDVALQLFDTGDYRNARLHLERAQQRALHAQRSMRATIARWNGYEHEHG